MLLTLVTQMFKLVWKGDTATLHPSTVKFLLSRNLRFPFKMPISSCNDVSNKIVLLFFECKNGHKRTPIFCLKMALKAYSHSNPLPPILNVPPPLFVFPQKIPP